MGTAAALAVPDILRTEPLPAALASWQLAAQKIDRKIEWRPMLVSENTERAPLQMPQVEPVAPAPQSSPPQQPAAPREPVVPREVDIAIAAPATTAAPSADTESRLDILSP